MYMTLNVARGAIEPWHMLAFSTFSRNHEVELQILQIKDFAGCGNSVEPPVLIFFLGPRGLRQ